MLSARAPTRSPRRRRRLGFIYPDRRARPGNRDAEAFSCFPAARPGREHPARAVSTFPGRRQKAFAPARLCGGQLTLAEEVRRRAPREPPAAESSPAWGGAEGAASFELRRGIPAEAASSCGSGEAAVRIPGLCWLKCRKLHPKWQGEKGRCAPRALRFPPG